MQLTHSEGFPSWDTVCKGRWAPGREGSCHLHVQCYLHPIQNQQPLKACRPRATGQPLPAHASSRRATTSQTQRKSRHIFILAKKKRNLSNQTLSSTTQQNHQKAPALAEENDSPWGGGKLAEGQGKSPWLYFF